MGNIVYVCCLYYRRRYLEGIFLPLIDKVKDGLCLKYLLCRGEGLEPHRSRSTLVTLLQAIITKVVRQPQLPCLFASNLKIICY